jgi:hypothetical protein
VSSINSLSACVFRSIVAHAFGTPAALMTSGRLSMLNHPTMAFSGVRNSCDKVARNCRP